MRLATLALAFGLAAFPAAGQTAPEPEGEQLLQALLREMRLLRTTLQNVAVAEMRAGVLLQREARQQQIVDHLQQEIDSWRMHEQQGEAMIEPHVEDLESRLRMETDPQRRAEIERELRMMRARIEQIAQNRQRRLVEMQQKELRLEEERARLETVRRQLDDLVHRLEP